MDESGELAKTLTVSIVVPKTTSDLSENKEKKRSRLKDDLAVSPEQTLKGKRHRKVNSLYSGYAIDKKTTQLLSQNASPTIEQQESPSQQNKREIIMSPAEAQTRKRNLPKGYTYEAITAPNSSNNTTTTTTVTIPAVETNGTGNVKRERVRGSSSNTDDFITGDGSIVEEEDDDYLSESEEDFEEGNNKKKRGYYKTKKQTLQMQLQELQSKLDLVTQNLAAAQNANAGTQSQSSNLVTPKNTTKRRGGSNNSTTSGGSSRRNKKKEFDTYLDSDYEEYDDNSDDSYTKKSRKKTQSPTMKGTRGGTPASGRRKKEESGGDVTKELAQCKRILQAMMKQPSAWPFNQPVDPVALGILDYFDIVKNPMDLKTILEGLNAGDYTSADNFAIDVRQVWKNAVAYNGPNHDVSKMAQQLSQFFEKKFVKVRSHGGTSTSRGSTSTINESTSSNNSNNSSIKQHMQSTITELRDSMIQMREEIQSLRKEKSSAANAAKQMARQSAPGGSSQKQRGPGRPKTKNKPTPIHRSLTREDARSMTFEEKRILSENINLLDAEALGKVVQLIHQRMPNLAQNGNDEIEIDIDAMDASTLRHLERFVRGSLTSLRKKGTSSAPPTKVQGSDATQNTTKSIQDVKQRLQELSTRNTAIKKKRIEEEGNEDVVIDDVQEENKSYPTILIEPDSSSSSDSSSDSDSSSSSSSSSSDSGSGSGPDKKKKRKEKHNNNNNNNEIITSAPASITITIDKVPSSISDQKDSISTASMSPVPTVPIITSDAIIESIVDTKQEEPQILHPVAVSKEVELKNVDAWKVDLDAWDGPGGVSSTTSPVSTAKDETWSQFQNRDLQNQLREKEREERERKEKEDRELERKKQEELRISELAEAEEKKKRAELEENERKQKEIEAKREAARKAREISSTQINDQNSLKLKQDERPTIDQTSNPDDV